MGFRKFKISNLKEYIWIKEKSETYTDKYRTLNLWKVDVSKDELEGVFTEEYIEEKLNGEKMDSWYLFNNYFEFDQECSYHHRCW